VQPQRRSNGVTAAQVEPRLILCRAKAAECERLAQSAGIEFRDKYRDLAKSWEELARFFERNLSRADWSTEPA